MKTEAFICYAFYNLCENLEFIVNLFYSKDSISDHSNITKENKFLLCVNKSIRK